MRKTLGAMAMAVAFFAVGCAEETEATKADLDVPEVDAKIIPKDFKALSPDMVRAYLNADGFPTIMKVCIEGIAFRVVSQSYASLNTPAVERIQEWDASCKAAVK